MDEIIIFMASFFSSLFVALLAILFDRWLSRKNELSSILSGLAFEVGENISIAKTIAKKAQDDIGSMKNSQIPFAPMPTFSESSYLRAKNSDVFLNHFSEKYDVVIGNQSREKNLVQSLHECYNSMRLVNSMMESEQKVKLDIMANKCPKEYGPILATTTMRTINEAMLPELQNLAIILTFTEPKCKEIIGALAPKSSDGKKAREQKLNSKLA